MEFLYAITAFIIGWVLIESTLYIANNLARPQVTGQISHNNFVWSLRSTLLVIFTGTSVFMHFNIAVLPEVVNFICPL